jgi:hypothetical protein
VLNAGPVDSSEDSDSEDIIIITDSEESPNQLQEGGSTSESRQSDSAYFELAWVPHCDPLRAEVALLRPGQHACDVGVETWSLDRLAETLAGSILRDGEKLLPVPFAGKANQSIGIFDRDGQQSGSLRIRKSEVEREAYPSLSCLLNASNYQWDCGKG